MSPPCLTPLLSSPLFFPAFPSPCRPRVRLCLRNQLSLCVTWHAYQRSSCFPWRAWTSKGGTDASMLVLSFTTPSSLPPVLKRARCVRTHRSGVVSPYSIRSDSCAPTRPLPPLKSPTKRLREQHFFSRRSWNSFGLRRTALGSQLYASPPCACHFPRHVSCRVPVHNDDSAPLSPSRVRHLFVMSSSSWFSSSSQLALSIRCLTWATWKLFHRRTGRPENR